MRISNSLNVEGKLTVILLFKDVKADTTALSYNYTSKRKV